MNDRVITEAELQARLESRIRAALPLLAMQIKLEHYLHLRLGHRKIVIDGSIAGKDGVRGRYDVLVLLNGNPLLLAELKAPDVKIGEDDIRQALSYARLHEPMVPLVLITNGDDKVLKRTYDGIELQETDIAANRLESILGAAAALAASASEDAVRTLLGASTDTWTQIFAAWSEEAIAAVTGGVRDFKCPIAGEFIIPRKVVDKLDDYMARGNRVLVLHGLPLAGITNTLAQLIDNRTTEPRLFVDSYASPDVLQFIANRLSRELSIKVSKDDLRGWLNTRRGLLSLTLVLDGLPKNTIDELVEYANSGLLRLVIGMDSETYKKISTVGGRVQQTLFGRSAVELKLLPLSDEEFHNALIALSKSFQATFFNGAQHAPELRWPRTLRVLAATLPEKVVHAVKADRHTTLMLPPVPGPRLLDTCSKAFLSDTMLKYDLQKLAIAFLMDAAEHITDKDWLTSTWGRASIDPSVLEQLLGRSQIDRLREQGFLSWVDTQGLGPRVLIRIDELLAHHVAEEWSNSLAKLTEKNEIIAELERLIRLSSAVPAGEIPLAAAIFRASQKKASILNVTIPYLMKHKPTTSRLREGARVDLLLKDGPIRLHFGEGMDEEVIGDVQYWLVLSHLASWPMGIQGYQQTVNFSIFAELGAFPHLVYQPKPFELAHVPRLHFHDIDGIGSVPCLHTGIVEPLLQAMLNHAHLYPNEIVSLAQLALDKKEVHLGWRMLTVAITSKTSTDETVQKAAKDVEEVLRDWWGNALKKALEQHGDSGSNQL